MNSSTNRWLIFTRDLPRCGSSRLVQGADAGHGQFRIDAALRGHLHDWVAPQAGMIVEILVAQGNGIDALGQHMTLLVADEEGMAGIGDEAVDGVSEAKLAVGFAGAGGFQRRRRAAPPRKVGDDLPASESWKRRRCRCYSPSLREPSVEDGR